MRHRKSFDNFSSLFNFDPETGKSHFRVLILDDEQGIIDSLAVVLKKQGYHFVGLTNPLAAIESIRKEHYDMLILDYLMEDANGEKVVKRIREFNQEIYILLLTGHKDLAPPLESLRNLDIQGYCEKSDRFEQLLLFIESGIKSIAQLRTIKKIKDELNENLKQQVAIKTADIRNLLDNAGQGFLTIGADLNVESEYSRECLRIFQTPLESLFFPELVFPDNLEQKQLLSDLLQKVFESWDYTRRDAYLSLLPKKTTIFQRHIQLEYKITADTEGRAAQMMVILTDITEQLHLKNQLAQEQKILQMVVRVAVNRDFLLGYIKEYQNFFAVDLPRIIRKQQTIRETMMELFRIVHSMKGNFAQLDMLNTTTKLHQFENILLELQRNPGELTDSGFQKYIVTEEFVSCLQEDLKIVEGILGNDFVYREETFCIEKSALEELERQVLTFLPPMESKLLTNSLRRFRYKPLSQLLRMYPDYVIRLAEQQGKPVLPFTIEGHEISVDVDRFLPFTKSLVHVFHNIVEHGIEKADLRFESGKPEYGKVQCRIGNREGWLSLSISDDGSGMEPERIKDQAVRLGLITATQAERLTEDAALQLIFREGFSSCDEATEFSGRGMGLAVVFYELQKIGGRVAVSTRRGSGTKFHFEIPSEALNATDFARANIVAAVTETT